MRVGLVDPPDGIAGLEEAFLVEGLGCFPGGPPIARSDVGAAIAHLGFAVRVHQLEFQAWRRHAQVASAHIGVGHEDPERSRLGHPQSGGHDDSLANFALLAFIETVPHGLGECGAGVEEHLYAR